MGLNVVTDAISGIAGGLFGAGAGQAGGQQANGALDADIARNEAELEEKRKSLYQQRLDIIKSNGMENWNPTRSVTGAPVATKLAKTADQIFADNQASAQGLIKNL